MHASQGRLTSRGSVSRACRAPGLDGSASTTPVRPSVQVFPFVCCGLCTRVSPCMLRFSDTCTHCIYIARTQSMRGLASQGSERWRRRGCLFSVPLLSCPSQRRGSLFSLLPRLRLLSPCSALLAEGGGRRGSKFKRAPAPTSPAACLTALLMLARILAPASAQVNCNAGYFGTEVNAVDYKGLVYRTLDGTSPLDTSGTKCQNYYLGLPSGWALAADNADSLAVIRLYRWGTEKLVVANGNVYWTPTGSAGLLYTNNGLSTSGSTYKVANCQLLILISKAGSACTACPAGESRDCETRVREAYVCVCVCPASLLLCLSLAMNSLLLLLLLLYSCICFTPVALLLYVYI
jgi:hypothetical protein